ncbi:MAG: XRE family transcriptional regulator [Cyanobacteria bacterium]|nr:XRE family transcriptional regulator [Cyanobacteriota bacterium]
MIYSDKQLCISKTQLAKLQEALALVKERDTDQAWLKQIEYDAIHSQIADIEAEIAEYELLKSGQLSFTKAYALEKLPHVLVQARIAFGMSQTELAEKLNMKPQQIQRYEATEYMGASLARLIEVSNILNVKTSETFEGAKQTNSSIFTWGNIEDVVWSQLPYKEMIKRKWFNVPRGANPIEMLEDYFLRSAGSQFVTALHRKKIRSGNVPNEFALIAWQARILELAKYKIQEGNLGSFNLDDRWLPELVALTKLQDGPKLARDLLANNGIILIIEKHLPGSYLDGAAMISNDDIPVIGLTLRHDRLDNFWFVLMHELGHIFLHLFAGMRFDFFDEENGTDSDQIEEEADRFALNTLIPEALWDQCLSRFATSEEAVIIDAEAIGVAPGIIAGRIRKELGNYTILTNLVGQGLVRSQFEEAYDDLD